MMDFKRSCGGCTACCKTHAVIELDKTAGKWCGHCEPKRGCKIYSSRPKGCAEFACEWLKGFGDEKDRPDKTRLVLDFISEPKSGLPPMLQIWEVTEGAFEKNVGFAYKQINFALSNDIAVLLVYLNGMKEFIAKENFAISDELAEILAAEKVLVSRAKVSK